MKRVTIALFLIFMFLNVLSQSNKSPVSLIPIPASIQRGQGNFILKKNTAIVLTSNQADVTRVADFLSKKLSGATGFSVPVKSGGASSNAPGIIKLAIINNATHGKEGYSLNITPIAVSISANKPAGLFYGMQTLLQLFPKEIESKTVVSNMTWKLPAISIIDSPRFSWRGLLFDVSRHFLQSNR